VGVGARGTVGWLDGVPYGQAVGSATVSVLRQLPISASYELGASTGADTLDRFALGGLGSSLSFGPGELWRVTDPAYPAGIAVGRYEDRVTASVGGPLSLYAERRRIGDALGDRGFTSIGLRVRQQVDAQPIGRIPAIGTDAGVACRLEYPGLGRDPHPCQQWSDYTFWLSATFGR
jgi:hypothetical protein